MEPDAQLMYHLWWLTKHFQEYTVKGQEFKDIVESELDVDSQRDLDELVAYIKLNY